MTEPTPPTSSASRARSAAAALTVAALAATGIAFPVAATAAVSTDAPVVINEVYGGGGNSGAAFNRDFVELYNPGSATVDLAGWSVQYAPSSGSGWQATPLSGSIAAGGSLLVGQAFGTNTSLPGYTADIDGSIAMSGSNGTVALVDSATLLPTADVASQDSVVDLVGYGSASIFAGAGAAPGTTNATSVSRDADHTHTADNAADFTAGAPTPVGSTSDEPGDPSPTPTPTLPADPVAISEIQGTADASPLVGQTVTTTGIVTAHYPSGGLNGYVLQAPGTGGDIDLAIHDASDAIFVYSSATVGDVALGETVEVTGQVSEYYGLTQLSVPAGGATIVADAEPVAPVELQWPAGDAERESLESMLLAPQGTYTVSNTYGTNQYGEVGLAFGDEPLRQPTDVAAPGSTEAAAVVADNAARGVVLDDGASTNFTSSANSSLTPPYVSLTEPVVVGGTATFDEPVVLSFGFDLWRFVPTAPVVGDGTGEDGVTFSNPRTSAPEAVGGDVSVASFNVLNYFTTLGEDIAGCEAYEDRDGDGNNVRTGCDVRGAWDAADLERQQDKIVAAINALDASVVGLMEIENSARLGETADEATATLVDALNDAAGSDIWAYVPSSDDLPEASEQDVITNAIIYRPAEVVTEGASLALGDQSVSDQAFGNAREPIGQVFAPTDGGEEFLFVVNHFKSKGSAGPWPGDADAGDGQGSSNESRVRQATALAEWVEEARGDTESVILAGDFNSYGQEDPMQVLYGAGYVDAETALDIDTSSYSFSGLSGSLDHILMNEHALARATGGDIWNINSGESVALEYSRYNNHGTLFYADDVYRSSDHDPVLVGLTAEAATDVTEVDVLTINDFHGRLEGDSYGVAGAAVIAGAVDAFEAENPNTLLVSAGDNIGASTFTSFIQDDLPSIDALVAAGLDLGAVGNHEFDKGFEFLTDVATPRYGAGDAAEGARYSLGANVYARGTEDPVLEEYDIEDIDGVRIAFIGTVTPDTAVMVSPDGIADIEFGDQLEAANRVAAEITAGDLADVIVLLTHDGAATDSCEALTSEDTDYAELVAGASDDIDAIASGHTHQEYACMLPTPGGGERPVIQALEYGKALGLLEISVDTETKELVSIDGSVVPLTDGETPLYPADPEVAEIVADAVEVAEVEGSVEVGSITGDILRGGTPPGDDRGVESAMGNTLADMYLWATSNEDYTGTSADIGMINPGGLRADLLYGEDGTVTYRDIANVQPFANTIVTVEVTGAQLEQILEEQWQPEGASRPKLHMGISEGFSYEYDPDAAPGSHIVSMTLAGAPVGEDDTVVIATNSFLAAGGDNFTTFTEGADITDTGQVDLAASVAYFATFTPVDPAPLGRAVIADETTPTPSPTDGSDADEDWVEWNIGSGTVEQGGTLTVELSGLTPGQTVSATLYSDPIVVDAIPAANAQGEITFIVGIPADFDTGAHTLVLESEGYESVEIPVTVVAAGSLAATGAEVPWGLALIAAFLVVIGGTIAVTRRRTTTA